MLLVCLLEDVLSWCSAASAALLPATLRLCSRVSLAQLSLQAKATVLLMSSSRQPAGQHNDQRQHCAICSFFIL